MSGTKIHARHISQISFHTSTMAAAPPLVGGRPYRSQYCGRCVWNRKLSSISTMTLIYRNSPHQLVHQRSIDVVNISGDHAPDHDTPNTTSVNIYNTCCRGSSPGRLNHIRWGLRRPTDIVEITWIHIWWVLRHANHSHRVEDERAAYTIIMI